MSHLTPGIMGATKEILKRSGIRYSVLDEEGGICCGRPAMQAGFSDQAKAMMEQTTRLIEASGARLLLVTCPICYKIFNEEYNLPIPVEHHSVFFNKLMQGKVGLFSKSSLRMSYHDPCDLGRGSGIYEEPRAVIRRIGKLVPVNHEKNDSLCCGGSLANLAITPAQRDLVTDAAYGNLAAGKPDYIVTSCPLCKKTFAKGGREIPVIDLAEALEMSLAPEKQKVSQSLTPFSGTLNHLLTISTGR
jgi:Fe-S oxidoreductase